MDGGLVFHCRQHQDRSCGSIDYTLTMSIRRLFVSRAILSLLHTLSAQLNVKSARTLQPDILYRRNQVRKEANKKGTSDSLGRSWSDEKWGSSEKDVC
jgi:hypothetical protein